LATDQIALLVSIASALIASLALGWNIYRDVVLKPRVNISFAIVFILHDSMPDRPRYMNIEGTNFGPGAVTLSSIVVRDAKLWRRIVRKIRYAIITPDYTNHMSGRLPAKLEPGEKVDLLLPFDRECLLGHEFTHIGLTDYYGRKHWSPRTDYRRAKAEWDKEFSEAT